MLINLVYQLYMYNKKHKVIMLTDIDCNCDVCYDTMKLPFVFNCGHSMCIICTQRYLTGNNSNICPFCRRDIITTSPNYSLRKLLSTSILHSECSQTSLDVTNDNMLSYIEDEEYNNYYSCLLPITIYDTMSGCQELYSTTDLTAKCILLGITSFTILSMFSIVTHV